MPNRDYREFREGPYQDRTTLQERADWVAAAVAAGRAATGENIHRERAAEAVYPPYGIIWD